ncbi:MAG: polyphosphate kinase 2 family protein [Bacteroidetes bacterium]|nr:polyphosphate kinase 2 family protein [Bacteroidota bacterium]
MSYLYDPKIAVTGGENFRLEEYDTKYTAGLMDDAESENKLIRDKLLLYEFQRMMYATDSHAVLLIFQAMDAAGKDSTISHVFSGMFPQAGHVHSFKAPNAQELDHDYLWRTQLCLPERGKFSIFNRSYYEEVLVTRVHTSLILKQRIPGIETKEDIDEKFWEKRYRSIRDHEEHLAENGTIILKFFLNVSREEQKKRFLSRINTADKNWKFSLADLKERQHWNSYQRAYAEAIKHTAAEHAPWFVIPADNKWFMRMAVCDIIVEQLRILNLSYPKVGEKEKRDLEEGKRILESEND